MSAVCAFAQANVPLGSAATFAVLAGSAITNTGNTVIAGNVGVAPGTSITGLLSAAVMDGTIEPGDGAVAIAAQNDVTTAYNDAMGQTPTQVLTGVNLGGLTLGPGVYFFSNSAQLTGTLTLNGAGFYIFQIGSTLTTASGAVVQAENGADAANVFWQVGSSATLGSGTTFIGNILAQISITNASSGTMAGRMLARTGAVTLADLALNYPPATIPGGLGGPPATPIPSSWILVLIGLAFVMLYQTRERWLRRLKNG
jgi:type VI secretion system secreted protein VgrG